MSSRMPYEWVDILHHIQRTAPEAIIAGGAIRDWYLLQPPKDLDIFINFTSVLDLPKRLVKSSSMVDFTTITQKEMDNDASGLDDHEIITSEIYMGASLPVNIIRCNVTPIERYKNFDFGFCRIAYNGKEVLDTPDFHDDINNKKITLLKHHNTKKSFQGSMERYLRFRQKYPWPLVIRPDVPILV